MTTPKFLTVLIFLSLAQTLGASHAAVAQKLLTDTSGKDDTAIVVKHGDVGGSFNPPDYEIVEGHEEIAGDPVNVSIGAQASWKAACADWKKEMREMNKDNQVLTLNCGKSTTSKDGFNYTVKSDGSYKLKVRIRDGRR